MSDRSLRILGIALALVASAIHFTLFAVDLIPGESTTVPAFAAMGLGFLACAAILALGPRDLYPLVLLYAGSLVFAWVATRGTYPIEIFGVTSKVAEVGLGLITVALMRAPTRRVGAPSRR